MTEEINKSESSDSGNLLKIGLIVVIGLIVGSVVLRWLAALAVPILLFINRDWTMAIVNRIIKLYQDNPIYGLGATIAAFLLLTPFSVLLFFRTIYNIIVIGKNPIPDKGELFDMAAKAKQEIEKLKIEDNGDTSSSKKKIQTKEKLMTAEEIRKKFKDDFDL